MKRIPENLPKSVGDIIVDRCFLSCKLSVVIQEGR